MLSPWWREALIRFYASGRRQLVLRVGRRGGKSSTLCRVAILEALYGEHRIPPGDIGIVGVVSVSVPEASQRLRTIRAILDTLGVKYKPTDGGIELIDRPVAFRVFAASLAAVVGGTWICAICDEVARWRDADSGANPAREVLASLRPTMATQANAKIFLSSSPLSTLDAHYDAFELGETENQLVAYAPSWMANPTLTRERLQREEPDRRVFAREYEALPMSALSAAFDPDDVDRAMREPPDDEAGEYHPAVMVLDPSSGRGDSFTSAFVQWFKPALPKEAFVWSGRKRPYFVDRGEATPRFAQADVPETDEYGAPLFSPAWQGERASSLVMSEITAFEGRFYPYLALDEIVARIAPPCAEQGIRVYSDQRENYALEAAFNRHGVRFTSLAWTAPDKALAVDRLRRLLAEHRLILPIDEALRREMHAYSERVLPSGTITYAARAAAKDDRVALLITACMADAVGALEGSPVALRPSTKRFASLEERETRSDH